MRWVLSVWIDGCELIVVERMEVTVKSRCFCMEESVGERRKEEVEVNWVGGFFIRVAQRKAGYSARLTAASNSYPIWIGVNTRKAPTTIVDWVDHSKMETQGNSPNHNKTSFVREFSKWRLPLSLTDRAEFFLEAVLHYYCAGIKAHHQKAGAASISRSFQG